MEMTKIKICGLQTADQAIVARDMGADFLGFVFVSGVKRCLQAAYARSEIERLKDHQSTNNFFKTVGLFADQPIEFVNKTALECDLDMVQLCGSESLDYCRAIEKPIIKSVHITEQDSEKKLEQISNRLSGLETNGHLAMLDSFQEGGYGGTGKVFNWDIAKKLAAEYDFLLAGGLNSKNVASAVEEIQPWGVDVSSGIETNGNKDLLKVAAFIQSVRPQSI